MGLRFHGGGTHDGRNDAVLRGGDHARRQQRFHFIQLRQLLLLSGEQSFVGAADWHVGQVADPVVLPFFHIRFQIDGLNVALFAGSELVGHMNMAGSRTDFFFFISDRDFAALGTISVGESDRCHAVRNVCYGAVRIGAARRDLYRVIDGHSFRRGNFSRHQAVQRQKRDAAFFGHHVLQVLALFDVDFLHPAVHGHFDVGGGGIAVAQGRQFADGGVELVLKGVDGRLQGGGIDGKQRLTRRDGVAFLHQRLRDGHAVVKRHVFCLADGQGAGAGHGLAQIAPGDGIGGHQRCRAGVRRLSNILLISLPAKVPRRT